MRYRNPAAFRQALEARLNAAAREGGRPIGRARKLVAFTRLLARLKHVAPEGWALKGGFALELRLGARARATRDVDLDWTGSIHEATEALVSAAALDLGDYFEFQVERTRDLPETDGGGVRFKADAYLAGRLFEQLVIDVGIPLTPPSPTERLAVSDLLAFAEVVAPSIPAVRLERHLAEKLHAYTRRYGVGRESSRPKDLIDMVLIRELAEFEFGRLRAALVEVFDARATHDLPTSLPSPPESWGRPYAALAREVGVQPDPNHGHAEVANFLDPVLLNDSSFDRWNPLTGRWREHLSRSRAVHTAVLVSRR